MFSRSLIAALALVALAPSSSTSWASDEGLPSSIRAEYEGHDEYRCTLPSRAVETRHLQGDATLFYIVDAGRLRCPGINPLCGSGGCELAVYVDTPHGARKILDDLAETHSFRRSAGREELYLHYRTVGTARFFFEGGCAVEVGTDKRPRCGAKGN